MDAVTILYDDDCGFCRWSADKLRAWDRRGRLRFVAMRSTAGEALLAGVPEERRSGSMHAVTADARVWSAGAAAAPILRALPCGATLAAAADVAPVLTQQAYAAVARRRITLGRLLGEPACRVDPPGGRT